MTTLLAAIVAIATIGLQQPGPGLAADEMTRVRELYALASYEDALERLNEVESRVAPEQAAQYRALCLIGLGRMVDAERTMERFVMAQPAYAMTDGDVSPRLATMFRETRLRVLPTAARTRYGEAKGAYDRQQFSQAARAFRDVLALLVDGAFVGQVEGLRDLVLLSEGFLSLAEGEIEKAERAAAAPPAPVEQTAVESAPVYTIADPSVQVPTELNRRMPLWDPPSVMARMEHRGLLELIIDEQGMVESATILESVHPYYDTSLVDATTRWRYRPALKDGQPVRFRSVIEIILPRR